MGGISASKQTFIDSFVEMAGYKAGIVLSQADLVRIFKDYSELGHLLSEDGPEGFRLRSEEMEDATRHLLFSIGNISSDRHMPISIALFHKYKGTSDQLDLFNGVMQTFFDTMGAGTDLTIKNGKVDPSAFMVAVAEKFGNPGLDIAMEFLTGANDDMHVSPWGSVRLVEWKDEVELQSLFVDESLETQHGQFFDQRFIDYIERNYDEIGNIHWRKFEGLAGEFFAREGFEVDMGPGRNDDGIDLRIYPKETRPDAPPLIIVQCKRQKAKIGKTLLKSVYADVLHEGAESGLIVTSSTLAPGTETMRQARGYPIEAADRKTLLEWLRKMRSAQNVGAL
jgi:HJR/Mrr/RecB family endonuclease